jgi:hypothetical integral membrane protein (TIGR02206 family)
MYKDTLSKPKNDRLFRYILGYSLLVFEIGYHLWVLLDGVYTYTMIPLTGFCAMTNLLTIYALLFNKHKLFNYIIYYAFTGALFALLFVDTTYGPPHFRYFHYFIVHFGFLLASLYYFVTNRIELIMKNLFIASISLFSYTLLVLIVDLILDENWFYLFESPVKEISDAFGRPWYTILWILSIILLTFMWYLLLKFIKKGNVSKIEVLATE